MTTDYSEDDFADLHKIAAQNGEGALPDVHAMLAERRARERSAANIVTFPQGKVRRNGDYAEAGKILSFDRFPR